MTNWCVQQALLKKEDGEITATLTFSDEPDTIEWTDKYGLKHKEVWLDK